ncbi:MAG: histidine phosphatase family protein [Verrucomicrobia bacterium]|nr:histidine phosphatase family protein [Verrucomicrobiota bacterium]
MTQFLLIRHATNDLVDKAIAGRASGVHLNDEGRRQASRLADALADEHINRIISSPLERAFETAEFLAKPRGLNIQVSDALHEVSFGDWTGKTLEELAPLPGWKTWNTFRSACQIPNGEIISGVQARMVRLILELATQCEGETIALCGHGDPIKTALFHFLGAPLDFLHRLEISPASVSTLEMFDDAVRVASINQTFY